MGFLKWLGACVLVMVVVTVGFSAIQLVTLGHPWIAVVVASAYVLGKTAHERKNN